MPEVSNSIDMPAPREKVWSVVTDLSRYGEWNTTHTEFPDGTPEDLSEGTTFREKVKIMGMPGEVKWTVTDVVEHERFAMDGEGPMGVTLKAAYRLEGTGDSTTFTFDSAFEGGALSGPMGGPVAKQTEKAAGESVSKLKELVAAA